ncbi:hypothetical protein AB838_06925 [Rhodobacteraceae bacterium (ex Bugula neritina AB1)]|nr:hypothetical protein AB838_06925 [Rhodobacteraceae bacterium (ex Bugula neritina AB1)]
MVGYFGVVLLIGVLGLWAATTVIGGAVIAMGQVIVQGNPKTIQNLDGGIVAAIHVENGDLVAKDQLLMQLDPTLLQINLDMAHKRLAAALALRARLQAEQAEAKTLSFDYPPLPGVMAGLTLDMAPHEKGQRAIFAARAEMIEGGRQQLAETLLQLENQITGVKGQIAALRDQLTYLNKDLENSRQLVKQGLARQSVLTEQMRAQANLLGELAAREAELARLGNIRRDDELKTLQQERSFMEGVVTDLQDVTTTIEDLMLEIATRSAQLGRIDIRAPEAGIVHEMQVTTIGGVVAPGADILQIVPQDSGLDFEVRVDPTAADQVYQGQPARVVLSAFDRQTTPELVGKVAVISPGVVRDERTGLDFYRLKLTVTPEELARLDGSIEVLPGMPIEVYLGTGERTVLSYLTQPLASHLRRTFRE